MPDIKTGVSVGGNLLGGALGSSASKSAAKTQSAAAGAASAQQGQANAQMRSDLQPYRESGNLGTNALMAYLGLGGVPSAPDPSDFITKPEIGKSGRFYGYSHDVGAYNAAVKEHERALADYNRIKESGDYGYLLREFTGDDLENDPGYQFGLNQGTQALDRRAAAWGNYFSGQALKAAQRFGQDYAGTKFNEAFSRDNTNKSRVANFLTSVSQMGLNAATQTGMAGIQTANNQAQNTIGAGNAAAAGQVGAANAWGNSLGNISNDYMLNRLYESANSNRIYQNASDTSYSGWDPKQLRAGTGSGWG